MAGVRVATYNLYLGADLALLFDVADFEALARQVAVVRAQLDATRFEERARAMAALLSTEQPDLVGLQEVSRWASTGADGGERVLVDFLPTLLTALEDAGSGYDAHAANASFGGGLPVFTRAKGIAGLELVDARRFPKGAVAHVYNRRRG